MMESMIAIQEAVLTIYTTEGVNDRKEKSYTCTERIKRTIAKKENNSVDKDNKRKTNKVESTTSDEESNYDNINVEVEEQSNVRGYTNLTTEYGQIESIFYKEQIKVLEKYVILHKEKLIKKRQGKVRKSLLR